MGEPLEELPLGFMRNDCCGYGPPRAPHDFELRPPVQLRQVADMAACCKEGVPEEQLNGILPHEHIRQGRFTEVLMTVGEVSDTRDHGHPSIRTKYAAYTNQGFLLREVVAAAARCMSGDSASDILKAVRDDDIFQLRTANSRQTIGSAVMARLEGVHAPLLALLAEGSTDGKRLANLYLILLQHRLLRELIAAVLGDARRRLASTVSSAEVNVFLEQARAEEPTVAAWSEKTLQKSRSNMLNVCVAAGLLEEIDGRAFALRPQWVPKPLRDELAAAGRTGFLPLLLDSEVL